MFDHVGSASTTAKYAVVYPVDLAGGARGSLDWPRLSVRSRLHALGRIGEPHDIAAAVAFLGSDDAAWITGHTLLVDGGVLTGSHPVHLSR